MLFTMLRTTLAMLTETLKIHVLLASGKTEFRDMWIECVCIKWKFIIDQKKGEKEN